MLHPSYAELIKVVNSETESDTPVVNSRYSIVMATAKRARQLVDGRRPLSHPAVDKPLSIAVDELNKGLIKIVTDEEPEELEIGEMAAEQEETAEETTKEAADAEEEAQQES